MTDDNDSSLAELQIDRQRLPSGASITQTTHDKRLSALIGWAWLAVGGVAVSGIYYVGNKLSELNITLARAVTQIEFHSAEIGHIKAVNAEQDSRLNRVERDVAVVEGKVFRGVDGYGKEQPRATR